jgi:hypothetical protein
MDPVTAAQQAALMSVFYYGEAAYRPELTRPQNLPPELRLQPPQDAIAFIQGNRGGQHWERFARLVLAELVAAPAAFPNLRNDVRALALLLRIPNPRDLLDLPGLLPGNSDEIRNERFFSAYQISGGLACQTRNFKLRAIYVDYVSDVTASVEVNRPVTAFATGLDARNWHNTLPDIWAESFEIDPQPPPNRLRPLDRALPVQPRAVPSPATYSGSLLFENVVWSFAPLKMATWRNVLDTSRQDASTSSDPSIRFGYRLYECLENEFYGVRRAGGIDVDHGHGLCRVADAGAPWSLLEARKVVRFTQPTLLINDLTFVFLKIWFTSLILNGACA